MLIYHPVTAELGIMPRSNPLLQTIPQWIQATEMTLDPDVLHSNAECARDFARWADARGITRPETVTEALCEEWWHYWDQEGQYLPSRRVRYMEALRNWYRWMVERKRVFHNPFMAFTPPPERKEHEEPPVETDALSPIIQYLDGMDSWAAIRDRAVLCIKACTDLKAPEIAKLLLENLDRPEDGRRPWALKTLRGVKELDERTKLALLTWLERRHKEITACRVSTPSLFLKGRRGTSTPFEQISSRAISRTAFVWKRKMEG